MQRKEAQAKTGKFDVEEYFVSYISKTYYKTASMISLGCRGLGIIYGFDIEAQRKLFDFGAHLGVAFQVHDDILDFTQNSEQLGKPAYNDIKEVRYLIPMTIRESSQLRWSTHLCNCRENRKTWLQALNRC